MRSQNVDMTSGSTVTLSVVTRDGYEQHLDDAMDILSNAMVEIEDFVDVPWPNTFVIGVMEPSGRAENRGPLIVFDVAFGELHQRLLAHELAHTYFTERDLPTAISEGVAEFFGFYFWYEGDMKRAYQFATGGCPRKGISNVHQSTAAAAHLVEGIPRAVGLIKGSPNQYCEYTTGLAFISGMYLALGHDMLSGSLRQLYTDSKVNADRLTAPEIYGILLSNTPADEQTQLQLVYHCLHGGPIPGLPNPDLDCASLSISGVPFETPSQQEPVPTPEAVDDPDPVPVAQGFAPLGNELLWVAHFDTETGQWTVYDPSASFSADQLLLFSGQSAPMPSSIAALTQLVPRQSYQVAVKTEQQVVILGDGIGRLLAKGLNLIVWNRPGTEVIAS